MTVVQRLCIRQNTGEPHFLAFSPDGKALVFDRNRRKIQICELHVLNIRRRLRHDATTHFPATRAVAFDPSSQFLDAAGRGKYQKITLNS
jgi:hypothetical protein